MRIHAVESIRKIGKTSKTYCTNCSIVFVGTMSVMDNLGVRQSKEKRSTRYTDVEKLIRAVECPVCREVPNPPIYNCINGHFVCSSCRPKLQIQKCAYCHGSFTKIRNYPLENVIGSPIFACQYADYGCNKVDLRLSEYEDHVKRCWTKFLEPGKVKIIPRKLSEDSLFDSDEENLSQCPRCQFSNPPRKLKCIDCNHNLRVPTPMYLPFDYDGVFSCMERGKANE